MKYIVRREVVMSVLVEADSEEDALHKASERDRNDWDQSTKMEEVELEEGQ